MASDDRWDDERRSDEGAFSGDQPAPPKRGMSTTVKVLLILFGVGGVLALLCCGGAAYFFSQAVQTDPVAIRATLAEIADMDVPDQFKPTGGMRVNIGVSMKMAIFQGEGGGGSLIVMEMNAPGGASEEQMRQQMQQQNAGQNKNLQIGETDVREFEIKGQTSTFQFAKATDEQGNNYRQVSGTFPGKGGTALLVLQVPESAFDEEQVVKMIESIH